MPYGILKVDQVTFTNAGVDQTISVSGIVASISGNITATGTISGNVIRGGTTVSGATVTGTAGQFGTITGNTAGFTTVTGTTVTGTTATFTSGVFTNISGGTHTVTSGVFASGTAANPSITFQGDVNTGIYSPGADQVAVATNGTGRLYIASDGKVGVGTTSPNQALHVNGDVRLGSSTGAVLSGGAGQNIVFGDAAAPLTGGTAFQNVAIGYLALSSYTGTGFTGNTAVGHGALRYTTSGTYNTALGVIAGTAITTGNSNTLLGSGAGSSITTGSNNVVIGGAAGTATLANTVLVSDGAGNERLRIDSSGRLLVGTSSARSYSYAGTAQQQIEGLSFSAAALGICNNQATADAPSLNFLKSRGTSLGSFVAVSNGDSLGVIDFGGTDGSNRVPAARIQAEVDGTPGANDMPGRLVFSTTADGASSPTERMRIDSVGAVLFKKTTKDYTTEGTVINQGATSGLDTSFVTAGGAVATFARSTNDGTIISLRQDGTEEGTISVSGTTISYNGAHLSRWSQLPSGAERTEILRGSVLSNIDEMCEWSNEDNEQLNRMKVSDVEGDKNVSGVFQAWDDDDDTYTDDFYCAMTGDFIIRIAEGVTVERGDLLMSAGDGTAKPQDDDIIRSKTIAKVTSTNVSCTYEDGSYCVPCVLMAC